MTSRRFASVRASALASLTALLALIALATPLWAPEPDRASGVLLLAGVAVEIAHSFRRKVAADQHSAWADVWFTLLLALVLLNTAWLAGTPESSTPVSSRRRARSRSRAVLPGSGSVKGRTSAPDMRLRVGSSRGWTIAISETGLAAAAADSCARDAGKP